MPRFTDRKGALAAAADAIQAAKAAAADPVQMAATVASQVAEQRQSIGEQLKEWAGSLMADVVLENPQQVEDFAREVAERLGIAQQVVGRVSAVSVAKQLETQGVKVTPTPDVPLDVRGRAARVTKNGLLVVNREAVSIHYDSGGTQRVTPKDMTTVEVLKRPAAEARWVQSEGKSAAVGRQRAQARLDQTIEDNLMLADRLAGQQVLAKAVDLDIRKGVEPRTLGFRRIIRPELSYGGTCGLCIAAADRVYHWSKLMPIHKRCHCGIAPITQGHDPGAALNNMDLSTLYDDAGGTSAAHLKRTRYREDQHGELGPILVPNKGYKPRGSDTASVAPRVTPVGKLTPADLARQLLPGFEESLATLQAQGLGPDNPKIRYHQAQIDKHRAALAQVEPAKQASEHRGSVQHGAVDKAPEAAAGGGGDDGGSNRGGGETGFGDFGEEEWRNLIDHAWERHAPDAHSRRGELGTKLPLGMTRQQFEGVVAEVLRRPRVVAVIGDIDEALRAQLDAGEVTLEEQQKQHVNLYARSGEARYQIRLAGPNSTAHAIDGSGVIRHSEKDGVIVGEPLALGKRPISGWDRPKRR